MKVMGTAAHLGIRLRDYDARIRTFIPHYEEMLDAAAAALNSVDRRVPLVVDLGIGSGELTARCVGVLSRARLIGVDTDEGMLALRPHGIAVVSLAPGFVRLEPVEAAFAAAGRSLQENLESPEYTGRAVVALASDGNVLARSGQTLTVGELAREYGFTDVDGRQLPPFHIEL